MTREPDRYEAILADWERRFNSPASRRSMFDRADLLAYLRQAADEALEKAAVAFAEAPTTQHSGAAVASVLRYLARDSAPQPAAAPAAEIVTCAVKPEPHAPHTHPGWCVEPRPAPPSEPVSPSLLPRVLAVLDAEYRRRGGDDGGGYVGALAAELRRYIAEHDDLLRECEEELADLLTPSKYDADRIRKLRAKLQARTAARTRGE